MSKGYLVLENGEIFNGNLLNSNTRNTSGECVFNTSMNGYQEIITDPSYAGQILAFTYPEVGNYGTGHYGYESKKPALRGLVIRNISEINGHFESCWTLEEFLRQHDINCLTGIDTRKLTRILRQEGTMGGVITHELDSLDSLKTQAKAGRELLNSHLVRQVGRKQTEARGTGRKIVVWDFGCKESIIEELLRRDCQVILVPESTTAEEIIGYRPQGLILSNGPGNPEVCAEITGEIRKLWGKMPMFGICLGHQLLALAAGAKTYKLKFGHRGANHTVKEIQTGKCRVTSQNHGYAVEASTVKGTGFDISFININDHTVEGLKHSELPVFSVQFHPESSPGPNDTHHLFDEFLKMAH